MSPAKKNALANYVNFFALAILGLFANPFLVSYLGPVAFGIWKSCQRLLDVATVADGRATQALKWIIAHRAHDTSISEKQRAVGAAILIWMIWLPLLIAIQIGILLLLPRLIADVPDDYMPILYWTSGLLAFNVLITGIASIPDSTLVGSNMGYRSMRVTTVVMIFANLVMVLLAWAGFSIVWLAGTLVLATVTKGFVTLHLTRHHITWFGVKRPEHQAVKSMASFSGWVLVWSLVTKFLLSSEIILLGALLGAGAVTNYVFTSYILQFALAICLMTASAMMPGLGKALGGGEMARARLIAQEARELVFAISTIICCLILTLNGPFVRLWAGNEFFMGPIENGAMALSFLQLAMLRCESQIQDTGLLIGRKVTLGIISTVLSLGLGYIAFVYSGEIWMMFIGLMLGRLPMSIGFPVMVGRMLNTPRYLSWKPTLSAFILITASIGLTPYIPDGLVFIPLAAIGAITVSILCAYVMLSTHTRAKLINRKSTAK